MVILIRFWVRRSNLFMDCVRDPEKRWIGRKPKYSNRRTRRIHKIESNTWRKTIASVYKSRALGIEPSYLTDYAYLVGPDATLFRA